MSKTTLALGAALALAWVAACGQQQEAPKEPVKPTVPVKVDTPPPKVVAPASAPGGGTIFGKRAPAVGDKYEEKVGMVMKMEMTIDPTGKGTPQKATMETTESETRQEEVLAVSGEAITKVKVSFVDKTATITEDKKERKRVSPVSGKTYVVEAKDGKIIALLDGDRPAPALQARAVKEACESLGKVDALYAGVPKRPLKPGDKVAELGKAMKDVMLARAKEMDVTGVTVTFKEATGDEGVFDVELVLSKVEKPMKFEMKLKGQARMSLTTGQPLFTKLTGPVSVGSTEGDKGTMKIEGTGTMELSLGRKKL